MNDYCIHLDLYPVYQIEDPKELEPMSCCSNYEGCDCNDENTRDVEFESTQNQLDSLRDEIEELRTLILDLANHLKVEVEFVPARDDHYEIVGNKKK